MTDVPANTGDTGVIDDAIQRAKIALDALRQQLAEKASEIGQEVNARLDEIQEAIDQIQASRQPRPDNTLPEPEEQPEPPQPTQLPADAPPQSQGGGTTPPPQAPPG